MFPCEHCKIFKNTYFEKHLRTAVSDSSYILYKKWNKIIEGPDWNHKITLSYMLSFVFIRFIIFCHSLSLIVIFLVVVIHCHYLSFVVTDCTTCCHWLHHSLSLVFIRCTTRCHSLPLFVTCTTRLSFYKRSVHDRKESRLAKYYRIKSKLTKISYVLHK